MSCQAAVAVRDTRSSFARLVFLVLGFALVLLCRAWALDPSTRPDQYGYAEWNVTHGIPYTSVRHVFQSTDGFLWIGTRGGLARFDGVTFRTYTKAEVPELLDDEIFATCEDTEGTLWIATARGIVLHKHDRWWRPEGLRMHDGSAIRWIECRGAEMWFATETGVFRYKDGRSSPLALPPGVSFTELRLVSGTFESGLLIAAQPTWWIKDGRASVVRDENNTLFQEIWAAVPRGPGEWWLGAESGFYSFSSGQLRRIESLHGHRIGAVRCLLPDHDGNLWIGTRGDLLRVSKDAVDVFERPGVDSLVNFLSLYEDKEGALWGGNDTGLVRFNDVKAVNINRSHGLQARSVVSVLSARDGKVWAGVWEGGLSQLDSEGRVVQTLRAPGSLFSDLAWHLAEAPDGTLWIGYYHLGLGYLKDGRHTAVHRPEEIGPRLRDMKVDHTGRLWVSSWARGLYRVEQDRLVAFPIEGVASTGALCVDREGMLWYTHADGLHRLDPVSGKVLERHAARPGELKGATVLLQDGEGSIWAFCDGMTIFRLGKTGLRKLVLPSWVGRLTYSAVLHKEELWVNMRNGIIRLPVREALAVMSGAKAEASFELYNELDGLRSVAPNVFGGQGACVDTQGRILFATSKGIGVLNPATMRRNTLPPSVYVDRLIIDKQSHHPATLGKLPPGRGEVEIHFTATALTNASQNRFKYRLLPIETEWVEAGRGRVAYYGGLSPGAYRFEVLGSNADRIWSPTAAAVDFVLPPHFYQTWWFYALITLSIPLVVWGYVRWHETELLREKANLERGVQLRTAELATSNAMLKAQIEETRRNALALRDSEEKLRQAQRMEAVGRLSGGIAHDFNNLLTVVQGNIQLIASDERLPEDLRESATEVQQASERASKLTRQLLAFSRKQPLHACSLDLNQVAAELTRMLRRILGEDIELTLTLCPQPCLVLADKGMLEQVLLNLCVNARDAMPGGGRLNILTTQESVPADNLPSLFPGAAAGEFVRLCVRDTGVGIPPEALPRIFEPFFTTKDVGKGTGLGLATVYGIIEQHKGWIDVSSAPGQGTEFRIHLPRVDAASGVGAAPSKAEAPPPGGGRLVLLVEDDDAVRSLARRTLLTGDYRVLEAASGPEALELWKSHGEEVAIVLTDVVMPKGMNGIELGEKLHAEKPGLRIIYASGYSSDVRAGAGLFRVGENFIPKPYGPVDLLRILGRP